MNMFAGSKYEGLDRFECRTKVVEDLKEQGYFEKQEKHVHSVGHCYRCRSIIEPLSTPQWYVKVAPLAEEAIKAVREKRIRIIPEGWENSYYAWMENINDWCITRQIWWGHRVPVWYCDDCKEVTVAREDPAACASCGSKSIRQDPDVLDTWFSSALWPFSTLGWPDKAKDVSTFYPTDVLVTAFDILFFWVARMIMMGLKFMDDVPFRDVYIHAIVRDPEGQKMSKSKGNVIDPLVLVDKYGADAFRFTLAAFAAQGRDIKFQEDRVQGYRNFINKLWNATKFILMNWGDAPALDVDSISAEEMMSRANGTSSRWILSRLATTAKEVNDALEEYRFNDAAGSIYQFTWHEFCDWYIETSKTEMSDEVMATLMYTLERVLRMLHPFMPFLTEEIWQELPIKKRKSSIMISEFPYGLPVDEKAEDMMTKVIDAVTGVRSIRGELNISPAEELDVFIKPFSDDVVKTLKDNVHYISRLARAKSVFIDTEVARPKGSYTSVKQHFEVYVKLGGIDVEGELKRLEKEKKKIEETLNFLRKKLHNEEFLSRAPKEVVDKEQQKYDDFMLKQEKVLDSIEKIRGLKE